MWQNRVKHLLLILLCTCFFESALTGNTPSTVEQQVKVLNQRLEQNLLQSNKHLENSEFHQAEVLTTQVLADLDILLEATMPLDERINQLIEKEEIILNETKKIKASAQKMSQQEAANKKLEDLIFDQVKNREKTKAAATLTKKQLEEAQNKSSQVDGQQADKQGREQKVLNEVKELLNDSANLQTAAIDNLEEEKFKEAIQFESDALETLKEALDKLRQHSKSQNQAGNNQQPGQQKNEQNQAPKKQQQQAQQQKSNENDSDKDSQESLQKKKMEAEEALKQLAKLRKKAREEQERRKRQFGIQDLGNQTPVEKDW